MTYRGTKSALAGLLSVCAVAAWPGLAGATVLDDFNAANLLADFQFNDANGTAIPDAVNSAGGGSFDDDADNAGVVTNGAGQLDANGKNNTNFGTNYVDLPSISSGIVYGLYDVSWDFDQEFDPAQDEEFRLSMITFDPRSTFVTAEIYFTRTDVDEVTLYGNANGTGSSDTPEVTLGASGDLLTILRADLDADTFELFYSSDDGASFLSAGSGTLDPTRGVESLRLVLNEDYTDDVLLIDRFALAATEVDRDVPAPAGIGLFGLGAALLLSRRRRK